MLLCKNKYGKFIEICDCNEFYNKYDPIQRFINRPLIDKRRNMKTISLYTKKEQELISSLKALFTRYDLSIYDWDYVANKMGAYLNDNPTEDKDIIETAIFIPIDELISEALS
jgi:hypothetical protein